MLRILYRLTRNLSHLALFAVFCITTTASVQLSAQTLTANGSRLPLTLASSAELRLSIAYEGGRSSDAPFDWWLALTSTLPPPNHLLFYSAGSWGSEQAPVFQKPLLPMAEQEILVISDIPVGTYTFYFGVEAQADGELDIDLLDYDSLTLTVNGSGGFSPTACGGERHLFDTAPLAADAFFEIDPLGATNPSGHTFPTVHTYMMLTDNQQSRSVYSPGRIQVFQVNAIENLTSGGTDYSMHFKPCLEVTAYFDHLSSLSERLSSQLTGDGVCQQYVAGSSEYRFCSHSVQVNFASGEIIGAAGGGSGQLSAALDFGLRDTRNVPLVYANAQRLRNPDQLYVACPYDYFVPGAVSDSLQAKLSNARQDEPVCGTVAYDRPNTAQGLWYLSGSNDYGEEDHLALVPSNRSPDTVGVLSVGNAEVGRDAYYFNFRDSGRVNRRFNEIGADGDVYCYDNLRNRATTVQGSSEPLPGVLLLKLDTATSLRLERNISLSSCPASPDVQDITAAAVSFER